jgi:membrane fusion protein, multidrug efflux system
VTWTAGFGLLGQFSAVDHLELRAQVGGTLTQICFKDSDIVHKGDLLFVIDRVPYEIKLAQANAQLESATARLVLANRELARIQMLQARQVETAENLDALRPVYPHRKLVRHRRRTKRVGLSV